ncbi:transcriptional regulator, partial [Salmonella enterica]|nr:transcriptional regulator [Salmonella enterica]
PRTEVCKKHSVTQGYLSVKIKKLQQLSKVIYEMKMFYNG